MRAGGAKETISMMETPLFQRSQHGSAVLGPEPSLLKGIAKVVWLIHPETMTIQLIILP